MKKVNYLLFAAAMVAALVLSTPMSVQAFSPPPSDPPAAGSWIWSDETVEGTIVPQYTLAGTYDDDDATLQSNGIAVSGPTMICHPY